MTNEEVLRWLFVAIFVAMFTISGCFRRRARQTNGTIDRRSEGTGWLLARTLVAAPLFLSILAYMVHPPWMAWSSMPLPMGVRWLGSAVSLTRFRHFDLRSSFPIRGCAEAQAAWHHAQASGCRERYTF